MPALRIITLAALAAGTLPAPAAGATRADFERTVVASPAVTSPRDVAFAPDGTAFITDDQGDRLLRVSPDGTTATIADAADTFDTPHGIALEASGNLVVAERGHAAVMRIAPGGGRLGTFTGFVGGEIIRPIDVTPVGDRGLLVTDQNHRVLRFTGSPTDSLEDLGRWSVLVPEGPTASDRRLGFPSAIVMVDDERFAVADSESRKVKLFRLSDGFLLDAVGGDGIELDQFRDPEGLAMRPNGDLLVADAFNDRVKLFPAQAGKDSFTAPEILDAPGMRRPACVAPVPGEDRDRIATCTGSGGHDYHEGEKQVDVFALPLNPQPPAQPETAQPAGPGGTAAAPAPPRRGLGLVTADLRSRGYRCSRAFALLSGDAAVCRRRRTATLRLVVEVPRSARLALTAQERDRRRTLRLSLEAGQARIVRLPARRTFARLARRTVRLRVADRDSGRRVTLLARAPSGR